MRHLTVPVFVLMFLAFTSTGCSSTPLIYADMNEQQKQDEAELQAKIENTAEPIARLGMRAVTDVEKRKEIAGKIIPLLEGVQRLLESEKAEDWQKELISQTATHLEQLTPEIQAIAQDAFDLFNGWINLPGLNDIIPDVIRDRLLAFARGALAGLRSITEE